MDYELSVERLFESLISGDRNGSQKMVKDLTDRGTRARDLISQVFWPTYSLIEKLHREDQLSRVSYQLATRLLRVLQDRAAATLPREAARPDSIFACCGPTDGDELGAQMAVDLLESSGYQIIFAGGNIPADEVLAQVHETRPDYLLMFASGPSDLPGIRHILDSLREINAVPNLKVAVGGGVFNRAEGLAEEIGVHLSAQSPMDMVELLTSGEATQIAAEVDSQRREMARRRRKAA